LVADVTDVGTFLQLTVFHGRVDPWS